MDIQKAIEWQEAFKRTYKGNPMEKEAFAACDMAIKALKLTVLDYESEHEAETEMK